jgi:tetratricopeptide (TPR) repeat protein
MDSEELAAALRLQLKLDPPVTGGVPKFLLNLFIRRTAEWLAQEPPPLKKLPLRSHKSLRAAIAKHDSEGQLRTNRRSKKNDPTDNQGNETARQEVARQRAVQISETLTAALTSLSRRLRGHPSAQPKGGDAVFLAFEVAIGQERFTVELTGLLPKNREGLGFPEHEGVGFLGRLVKLHAPPTSSPSRDEHASPTEAAPRVAPSRLFWGKNIAPDSLFGRENVIQALDAAWLGPKRKQVVTIVAWGGVGKTSVVAHWAARKLAQPEHGAIDAYFDWSFYSQGTLNQADGARVSKAVSADLFFKTALDFFGDPGLAASNAPSTRKAERLAELVGESRSLLVLDGLEPLQDITTGELLDDGLRILLRGLAANNEGLCLITTRKHLPELIIWQLTTAPQWELNNLTKEAGAALQKHLGVKGTDTELESLTKDVKGHALTLSLLGKYLAEAHAGDVRKRDQVLLSEADYAEASGHAFRVLEAYERWFMTDGRNEELQLLRLLGLFDRPATPDCLAVLREAPAIPSLTDLLTPLSDAQWNLTVSRLARLGLVEEQPWEPPRIVGYTYEEGVGALEQGRHPGEPRYIDLKRYKSIAGQAVDTHPLIRSFFAEQLRGREAASQAHGRLFEHLQSSVPYWPEGLDGLQPLYQAIAHGCKAGRYKEACIIYSHRVNRGESPWSNSYSTKNLGAAAADLAAASCLFEDDAWSSPAQQLSEGWQAWLLNQAGTHLRSLGRLIEAREPIRNSADRFAKMISSDPEVLIPAAVAAGNLSELDLMLGSIEEAVQEGMQSGILADASHQVVQMVTNTATYANAVHQAGGFEEAETWFRKAEALHREFEPTLPFLESMSGFHFCELLQADAERAAWRELLSWQADSILATAPAELSPAMTSNSRAIRPPRLPELAWKKLVAAHRRATQGLSVAEHLRKPLDIANAHLILGREGIYYAILDPPSTFRYSELLSHIEHAVDYFRQSGEQVWTATGLLGRAFLRVIQGRAADARSDLDEVEYIANRGPMPLLLADLHLYRARLFFRYDIADACGELERARSLVEKHGYRRRLRDLEDASMVIRLGKSGS